MLALGTKRRVFLLAAFTVALSVAWTEAQEFPSVLVRYPEVVLHNGKIVTMDDDSLTLPGSPGTVVQAMAVRDGRVLALGSDEELLGLVGPETRTFDVGGRTVIPGLTKNTVTSITMPSLTTTKG